jgi:hypothetical protein
LGADSVPSFNAKLERVLDAADEEGHRFKVSKVHLGYDHIDYLGWYLDANGKCVPPGRLQKALEWTLPTAEKELQRFIGYTNYYRSAIPGLTAHLEPFYALHGRKKWPVTPALEAAWKALLACIANAIQVASPIPCAPTEIEVDASEFNVGYVAFQFIKGIRTVVGVGGRRFSGCEQRWHVRDQEFFAALYALRQCSVWLGNAPVAIMTDHQANVGAKHVEMDPSKQASIKRWSRWLHELSFYNVTITYIKGAANPGADYLSRDVVWGRCSCPMCEECSPRPQASDPQGGGGNAALCCLQ